MKSWLLRWMKTSDDISPTILRVGLAGVMFAHGAQKMLGWFGGHGPSWTVEMWGKWFGFNPFVTWLVIIGEFLAPIFIFCGLFTRFMAAVIAAIMLGAIYFVHFKWGFYMNWYNSPERGEGFEYHLIVLSVCWVLLIKGSGKWSFDKTLST